MQKEMTMFVIYCRVYYLIIMEFISDNSIRSEINFLSKSLKQPTYSLNIKCQPYTPSGNDLITLRETNLQYAFRRKESVLVNSNLIANYSDICVRDCHDRIGFSFLSTLQKKVRKRMYLYGGGWCRELFTRTWNTTPTVRQ